ncbi:MAG: right-handed parallel beta-helix repeat-containing protein, partial [Candidatus Peribacteraceae bacterium]|nr:right-handed parallel beta-helix repeat-containing protein [Candidatus Peribacteraceae bacterium]
MVGTYSSDSILVKYKTSYLKSAQDIKEKKNIETKINAKLVKDFYYSGIIEYKLDGNTSVEDALNKLSNDPRVLYAEPNYLISTTAIPNDPGFNSLWGLNNSGQTGGTPDADINAPDAWNISTGSSDVVVAVIDTGVDYNHEDLANNMWTNPNEIADGNDTDNNGYIDDIYGIDTSNDDSDPMDDKDHGTHCAGTIGAAGNNNTGVVGLNWNVSIMALKFLDSAGMGTHSDAIECIEYMIMMKESGINVNISSNSWRGLGYSQSLYDVIAACRDAGILFVAAAGNGYLNNNDYEPLYPASYNLTNIISVAATDHNDTLASFSNYGPMTVDVAAPGVNINSTVLNNMYDSKKGTSMATPHVSGLAALIASTNSSYNYVNLKNLIMTTINHKSSLANKMITGGRINAYNALSYDFYGMDMLVHSPGNNTKVLIENPIEIVISICNGSQPIIDATVNVTFNSGEPTLNLSDNGIGVDQVAGDGYYSGIWAPQQTGIVVLNISVSATGYENISKEVTVVLTRNNVIEDNTISYNGNGGIVLLDSPGTRIINNTVISNDYHGIALSGTSDAIIANNIVSSNKYNGILLFFSGSGTTISNNTILNNQNGIKFTLTSGNTIVNNIVANNTYVGIFLGPQGNENTIRSNNVTGNMDGIYQATSSENLIEDNNIFANSRYGIYSSSSSGTLSNNKMNNNSYGIYLYLSSLSLVNNTITQNDDCGIYSYYSDNCTYSLNNVSLNSYTGIFLNYSDYNRVDNNTITENLDNGIYMIDSSSNKLEENTVTSNSFGFYLYDSDNNTLENNSALSNSNYGFYLNSSSEYNEIYHNAIIDNTYQSYDAGTNNAWDNGYPDGGNYWGDYTGVDYLGGSGQNLSGGDGIGDWPYNITGNASANDNYPLMSPDMNQYTFWAKSLGTSNLEDIRETLQTSDGGYIVAGFAYAAGAGNNDACVVKFNATSDVEWQKAYGGFGDDRAMTIQQTDDDGDGEKDDGYIIAGYSFSFGNYCEYWIFKLDCNGSLSWSKSFGSATNWDASYSIHQTDDDEDGKQDDGYIIAGYTRSPTAGAQDYWVLKLFQNGSIDWQKHYGGTGEDIPFSIEQTDDDSDGYKNDGYIIAGRTKSFSALGYDYWILKLNETGIITWQKRYGGSGYDQARHIQQTSDGGYIVTGSTKSYTEGSEDIWVLKLDANGTIEWQKNYGNSSSDLSMEIQETTDGGFIIGGWTYSYGVGGSDAWI